MPIPPFILDLRAKVGTLQLWLPGVTVLVRDDTGRILLGQRADTHRWTLISGIPDPGEEMAVAAAREVLEETEVKVEITDLIAVSTVGPVTYPNGDVSQYVDHFFAARAVGGQARVGDDESIDVGWFAPTQLPQPQGSRLATLLEWDERYTRTGRTWFAT